MTKVENLEDLKNSLGLLLLRLFFGGIMLVQHGIPKLMKLINGAPYKFPELFGLGAGLSLSLAVFSEVLCAFMILIGLFTRLSVLPLIVTMLIAAFMIHGADPFGKKELAILYAIAYLCIFLLGPGKYSIDHRIGKE